MPIVDNPAALSCGCNHQQNQGAPLAGGDFTAVGEMDAVNGVYTLDGEAAALTDIIDLAHPDALFDPVQDMDEDGVKVRVNDLGGGSFSYVVRILPIKNPLLATTLAGFTVVLEGYWGFAEDTSTEIFVSTQDADFNVTAFANIRTNWLDLMGSDAQELLVTTGDDRPPQNEISKCAITFTDEHMAISVNGQPFRRHEHPGLDPAMTSVEFGLGQRPEGRLRSFAFYAPVDDADLPTLSAL